MALARRIPALVASAALGLAALTAFCVSLKSDIAGAVTFEGFRTTIAGQPVSIGGHMRHDQHCIGIDPPRLSLIVPPEHGRVCAKADQVHAAVDPHVKDSKCLGKWMSGVRVFYEPDIDFEGVEAFEYQASAVNPAWVQNLKVFVTVKARTGSAPKNKPVIEDRSRRQQPGPIPPCVSPAS